MVIIDFVLIFTNFFYDKKKLPFYFCFITSISFDQLDFSTSTEGRRLDATGINGQSLLKKYAPDATGSPFINPNWVQANLTLSEGKITGPISIKLNIENNTLYFLDSSGKEMVAIDGLIKKIDCYSFFSKDNIGNIFKNGYPKIDKQNENYYYQVFTECKIELLAKRAKYIRVFKDEMTGQITKEFVEEAVTFYIYANNSMQKFHHTKNFVTDLLKDKEHEIEKFIDNNKINFKKNLT